MSHRKNKILQVFYCELKSYSSAGLQKKKLNPDKQQAASYAEWWLITVVKDLGGIHRNATPTESFKLYLHGFHR